MRRSVVASLAILTVLAARPAIHAGEQTSGRTSRDGSGYAVPRTPWGDPDLQGIWPSSDMIGVPLQRDPKLGTRDVLTDDEFEERLRQAERQSEADLEEFSVDRAGGGDGTGPPPHWLERGRPQRQASLVVDPPDGRLPPMTPYGEERAAER